MRQQESRQSEKISAWGKLPTAFEEILGKPHDKASNKLILVLTDLVYSAKHSKRLVVDLDV
jgi:hypothetical protein